MCSVKIKREHNNLAHTGLLSLTGFLNLYRFTVISSGLLP